MDGCITRSTPCISQRQADPVTTVLKANLSCYYSRQRCQHGNRRITTIRRGRNIRRIGNICHKRNIEDRSLKELEKENLNRLTISLICMCSCCRIINYPYHNEEAPPSFLPLPDTSGPSFRGSARSNNHRIRMAPGSPWGWLSRKWYIVRREKFISPPL